MLISTLRQEHPPLPFDEVKSIVNGLHCPNVDGIVMATTGRRGDEGADMVTIGATRNGTCSYN